MSVASTSVVRDFRVGNVLNRAFDVCGASFLLFGSVMLVASVPNLFFTETTETELSLATVVRFGAARAVGLFLNTIGEALILLGAFQYLRGQPVVLGEVLRRSLARFFP